MKTFLRRLTHAGVTWSIVWSLFFAPLQVRPAQAQDGSLEQASQTLAPALSSFKEHAKASRKQDQKDDLAEIVIYHTNDIHGHIDGTPANPKTGAPASGGAASLATLLKGSSQPYLWIDSGDWFQGTPEGNLTHGQAVVDIFDRLHLAVTTLGNHEYDYGEANLKTLIAGAQFPVLGANVASAQTGAEVSYTKPYIIKTVQGVKIGIIGLLTHDMDNLSAAEHIRGLQFHSEANTAKAAVRELKKRHVQVIIAATHLGVEEYGGKVNDGITEGDIFLAKAVPEISVILGGHTHTEMKQPLIVQTGSGSQTMITQTRGMLSSVYKVVLYVSRKTGAINHIEGQLIYLDPAQFSPDVAIAKVVADDKAAVDRDMSKPIGSSSMALEKDNPVESTVGDWITDGIRSYAHTDVGAMNTGGIRAGLPAGPLTYRDAYQVDPFDDYIVKVEILGTELKKVVEQTLGAGGVALQYSGLEIIYNPTAPAGQRLLSLKVGGILVQDDKIYTIATPEFVAKVDGSFKVAQKKIGEKLPLVLHDILAKEITDKSPVVAPSGGRVKPQ